MENGAQARRRRVPAAERRQQLIDAAVIEFARGGLDGTPVQLIAQRVGVAQPYVFSLFPTKRDLFLAAVDRGFERVNVAFETAAKDFDDEHGSEICDDDQSSDRPGLLPWMGMRAISLMANNREVLLLQLHAYAACDDETIQAHVRQCWAELSSHVQALSDASNDELQVFFGQGMWLTVLTALGVESINDLSVGPDADR